MLGRNKPTGEDRSPEERARAAAERAARRAARTGEQSVIPPVGADPERDGTPEPEPVREAPPEPVYEAPPESVYEAPPEPVREAPPEPVYAAGAPPVREEDDTPPAAVHEEAVYEESPPPPPPRRRTVPAPSSRRRPPVRRGRSATVPARPAPPAAAGRRHAGGWLVRILAVVALLAVAGALWLVNAIFQPFHPEGRGSVAVTIEPGWNVGRIGEELEARGVIDSGTFFNLHATLTSNRGELKPGDYTLARNMSYGDAVEALTQGPKAVVVPTFTLTIPEGGSRREVAPIADKADLEGDYLKATKKRRALRKAHELGLPSKSDNPEGFLFPATYELVKGGDMDDLVAKQLDAFGDNFAEVDMKAAKRRNLTRYDVVIIASMVEREAQLDKERPLVAAVIHNRLREGIPLGIDATIRYAENNWTQPLRQSELTRPGPYNTRLNRGLPPTPIGNPGAKSLRAAAKPADVDYLYYVVKPGTCGEHAFSSTDAEFQRDVARYNAEREKAGGKSPTTC